MIGYGLHPPWVEGCAVIARNLSLAISGYAYVSMISLVRTDYFGRSMGGSGGFRKVVYLNPPRAFRSRSRIEAYLSDKVLGAARIGAALKFLDLEREIDIVHIHNVSHLMVPVLVRALSGKAIIVQVNGVSSTMEERLSRNLVDDYICTSRWCLSYLIGNGIERGKVHIVPPIIDCNVYRPLGDASIGREPFSRDNPFVATYIGNIFPERFPPKLLSELKRRVDHDVELRIITPNTSWNRHNALGLRDELSRLGLRYRIIIRNLNEGEKLAAYNTSDLLLFPFEETSKATFVDPPLTVLEGMACGRMIVTTKVLSLPDVITPEVDGFLVDPGDYKGLATTLRYTLDHFGALDHIKKNARATIERHYSSGTIASKTMDVYQSALR